MCSDRPQAYQNMVEQYEDALLLVEANKRLSQNVDYIPQEAVLKDPDVTEEDLKDVDVELE